MIYQPGPQNHYGFGPAPQTKPDLRDVLGLWDMMSPEHEARTALAQHALQSAQQGDAYAHQFGGAPNMDAAHLFLGAQQHEDAEPYKLAQLAQLQERQAQSAAEQGFAQEHGAPSLAAYRLQSEESDRGAARQALEETRQQAHEQHVLGNKEKGVQALLNNPMVSMPDDPKHPQPPFARAQKSALLDTYPDISKYLQPADDSLSKLTPAQRKALLNSR